MIVDSPHSAGQPDFWTIGWVICGLMFLYPPWTENPGQVWVGDSPVNYDGRGVDYVPYYGLNPLSPIRSSTQPQYRLLWDPPSKQFMNHTSVGIAWGRLILQWVAVAIVLGVAAGRSKAEATRVDASKAEATRVERARVETTKAEATRTETAKAEATRAEIAGFKAEVEATSVETAKAEATRVEIARFKAQAEAARFEAKGDGESGDTEVEAMLRSFALRAEAEARAKASNDLITRVPTNSLSPSSAARTTPIRQTYSPEELISRESGSGKKGLHGYAAALTFMLAISVYAVLTAPGLKVSIGVGLLFYGAMFGIPLILVIIAILKNKN